MRKLKSKYKWTKRIAHFRMLEFHKMRVKWMEKEVLSAYETFGTGKHTKICLGISGVLAGKHWTEDEVKRMGINPKDVNFKELNEEISKVIDW